MDEQLLKFWAKSSSDDLHPRAYHPLLCHMIDVASVAERIWDDVLSAACKRRFMNAFGTEGRRLVALIAGLHDLGKCSPPFALRGLNEPGRRTELLLELLRETQFWRDSAPRSIEAPHGFVTALELPQILSDLGINDEVARQISILIGGHHGVFPTSHYLNKLSVQSYVGDDSWGRARQEIARSLADLLGIDRFQTRTVPRLDNGSIMILAGLVSVSDWIGSDTQFFNCAIMDLREVHEFDLEEYLRYARRQAEKALEQLGWLDWVELTESREFGQLFPFEPRRLQRDAIEIAKELNSPGIVIIESPMGEGKTEAAMYLADHFNSALGQRGMYFGLPTQATSNQMFGRVKQFLTKRFAKGNIQLQLQHGHSSLSAEFGILKNNFHNLQGIYEDCEDGNCVPNVVAAEWFTYRKRGLLAPFGVGTIDQALMAVLQTKHVFVRLFGLAHKTIIIDEVHAYDAYMSTLLERLLEWLGALESPVILLSATLPKRRRIALLNAYLRGTGFSESESDGRAFQGEDRYPRISYASGSSTKIRHISSSSKNQVLHLKRVGDEFGEKLRNKLEKGGGCVAIVCNTVRRAQELYQQLSRDRFFKDKIDLLHSRFRFCDREEREKRVLRQFGKPDENGSCQDRPKCAVLISTQIIEQSLDIDFDLMISDLAPIDLLLQRAGRLHRHVRSRPNDLTQAEFWIIDPPVDEFGNLAADSKGLPDFGMAGAVYDKHILLRSWLLLNTIKNGEVGIPDDVEGLIEAVYEFANQPEILDENKRSLWEVSLEKCLADIESEKQQAQYRYIKRPAYGRHFSGIFASNLEEDSPDVHLSLQAATRLTEPTATVICVWEKDGTLYLNENFAHEVDPSRRPSPDSTRELLRCSVSISSKSVVFKLFDKEVPKGWQESALLRNHRILIFDENRRCEEAGHVFRLDGCLGLTITKQKG